MMLFTMLPMVAAAVSALTPMCLVAHSLAYSDHIFNIIRIITYVKSSLLNLLFRRIVSVGLTFSPTSCKKHLRMEVSKRRFPVSIDQIRAFLAYPDR